MSARLSPLWRFVLLALLAFGIAGMHTLGHPHQAHDAMAGMPDTHVTAAATPDDGLAVVAPRGDIADEMCLAVLTSAFLLIGAAVARRWIGRDAPASRPRSTARHDSTRGPPRLIPSCVAIAAVAVLRI
ncbi:MAG TPA: DUF6153 family protein [Stackebrandtia sp.]|jgi:hypothetical protein|uniref:DUF6153 family protein n=1 Tax=Stackebrandtia sp. TaxID=2023065 RepID=UPI002D5EE791|nr:DUF6153 family protein [Stackebrandtia sp.]HZE37215.1 DUF6153 family protein [Stackebrandtia sp.]